MSIDWVQKNVKVYSKELDLHNAYKIPGLRAVFGESYPDPVRVVSLEYDVDDIAKDIENPVWRKTSIEFCGGTYELTISSMGTILKCSKHAAGTSPRLEISRSS